MKLTRKMFLTAATSLLLMSTTQAQSLKEINFGIISTDSSSALKSLWACALAKFKLHGMAINQPLKLSIVQAVKCLPNLSTSKVDWVITHMSLRTVTVR